MDTAALPIEEIEFPAITICPQGSVNHITETVLFKQLKEYIIKQRFSPHGKPGSRGDMQLDNFNLTYEVMMEDAREFLENVYPGAKGKPTKFVQTMASSNPEKTIQSAALLIQEEEKECSPSASEGIAQILVNVNHPQQSMSSSINVSSPMVNAKNEICPDGFQMLKDKSCVHVNEDPMTYSEANDYCKTQHSDAQLLYFESYESFQAITEVVGNRTAKEGKV